ncbi:N-acetylglucosamine-6-phosphate deacetylase [Aliiglaciecola sp. 2_MG-2023]|uniref:N-acetylglucosamine-6-phosphate deacetylase n=1 Tax=unclassified Aliiglaciecola TaxID=2593648 RepID=UPI0026E14E28|nr:MULTISPECIES: N-acetylglucosamine-6-phosphate deacetylase [unclassified Aliiglaciecola]MDO6711845.1 N-acetylglucosamine-6-phosphate deacetylase [Aliiglaciecola sp. 2_MG-2023]MDO6752981.1 N-acetylglucosamine-6-phosphate deacetylase [Aliiglaciecola sp. 1_MG-2023]
MTQQMRLHAQRLFDGQAYHTDQVLVIEGEEIIAIDQDISQVDTVLSGLVAPGFVDLQVNGGGGVLFNTQPTLDSLKTIFAAHARYGTTGLLPTVITDDIDVMNRAADAVAQGIRQNEPGILGIHFEGPHISTIKKGAHSQQHIRPITDQEWTLFKRQDLGNIVVTLAPEVVPEGQIKELVSLGVKVCIGHSNADGITTSKAIQCGASGFTHLFNAMSPISAREPGVTGVALTSETTRCGLIVDGHHVDDLNIQLALKTKPKGGIFLVTDAMPPVGSDATEFDFFDRQVTVRDGRLTSTTGELAGAAIDMASSVRYCHFNLGISVDESIRLASQYPKDYLSGSPMQTNPKVQLAPGKIANFIQLDEKLVVQSTWVNGNKVFFQETMANEV